MNNQQIHSIIKKTGDINIQQQYGGIYPSNGLPRYKLKRPTFIIANTDSYGKPGKHWVAFYFPRRGPAEFFDSTGHPPSKLNKNFAKFLKKNSKKYVYNRNRLQGVGSSTCGPFVMYYVLNRGKGVPMNKIIDKYDKYDLQQNDVFVSNWIEQVM